MSNFGGFIPASLTRAYRKLAKLENVMTTRDSKGNTPRPDLHNLAVDPAISAIESSLRMTAAPVSKKPKRRTYRTAPEHS